MTIRLRPEACLWDKGFLPNMNSSVPIRSLSNEHIALLAYLIWEQEGRPEGRSDIHWFQAEYQLIADFIHEHWMGALRAS